MTRHFARLWAAACVAMIWIASGPSYVFSSDGTSPVGPTETAVAETGSPGVENSRGAARDSQENKPADEGEQDRRRRVWPQEQDRERVRQRFEELGRHSRNPEEFHRRYYHGFEQALETGPSATYQVLGTACMDQGNYQEAYDQFTTALAAEPGNPAVLEQRSMASYRLGNYTDARQDALAILAQNPADPSALSMIELTQGRSNPSGLDPGVAVAVSPNGRAPVPPGASATASWAAAAPASTNGSNAVHAESLKWARDAAHDLDMMDWKKAGEDAAKSLAIDANNAQAYYYQTVSYMQMNQIEAALQSVDRGLGILPDDLVLMDTKAYLLNRAGRHEEAQALAQSALAKSGKKDAQAWYNLAFSDAGLGTNHGKVIDSLAQASRLDPSFGSAYDAARIAPQQADLKYLFAGASSGSGPSSAAVSPLGGADRRFWLLVLASVVGGLLMAAGFLHVFVPRSTGLTRGLWNLVRPQTALLTASPAGLEDVLVPGTYQIVRKIGSGGMGTVFEAMDVNLRRRVAIKRMRAEIRDDPRERRRFIDEARSVASLRHPGIVEIFSIEENPELFLVFEYVEGKTLDRVLAEKGRLDFDEARRILGEVCEALQYAHASHVIHRDLKPSNIMLTKSGSVKVMDFGVARQVQDVVSRMMTNTICGTPSYMAPEIEQGVVSRQADVYSLGVCLYELLSGAIPFSGTGAGMLLNKTSLNFEPLSRRVAGLPKGVDPLLAKALQPEPSKRYSSPSEFKAALDALAA